MAEGPSPGSGAPVLDRVPDLPPAGGARARTLLGRALTRRCPYCGGDGIFSGWFTLRETCPHCGVRFEREDGYFLGGYAFNLVGAGIVGIALAVWAIFFTEFRHAPLLAQEALAVALAVLLPVLFFPFSRTLWMAFDLVMTPASGQYEEHLRTRDLKQRPSGSADGTGSPRT